LEKAWYYSYVTKLQGGLDHDVHGLGFSNVEVEAVASDTCTK